MLEIIDRTASRWLNWRTDQRVKNNPACGELGIKKFEITDKGMEIFANHPGVAIIAEECAQFLKEAGAENYYQFDMQPRIDFEINPIRVTVQWAKGMSPAEKNAKLMAENDQLRDGLRNLVNEIAHFLIHMEDEISDNDRDPALDLKAIIEAAQSLYMAKETE